MEISKMSNEQLRDEYVSICETIDVVGCFGTKDLMLRDALEREIYKRGGEVMERVQVSFPEIEDEEE